jgi:O-antigen/teichoic acid export membrane protein
MVQFAGKAIQLVLATLTLKIISNYLLNEQEVGVYGAITEYALFFSVVANLGIFGNVVRKMADAPADGKIFVNALLLRIITAVLFFATGLVILLFSDGNAANLFFTACLIFFGSLLFDYITSVCDGALQANYMMGRATIALVAGRIINFGLVLALIKIFPGNSTQAIPWLFLSTLAGSIFTATLSLYFVARKIKLKLEVDTSFMIQVFKISLPFGIINIINNLYFRFLPDYFAHGALTDAQFATFNISFRIAQVVSLLSTFLMFSALPGLKEYIDQKHWEKVHRLYKKIWQILALSGTLLVIGGSLAGPLLIELLTHKKFFLPEFWFVLPLMLLLAAISYGYDLVLITLFALEKDFWLLKRECLALLISLLFFGISTLVPALQPKLLLIIAGAIAGETTMVTLGLAKIKRLLKPVTSLD